MKLIETGIPGLVIIEPEVHGDSRGYFLEAWHADRYSDAGLPGQFVQCNISCSGAGVIRGLHYQNPRPQGKLVTVVEGRVFDVAVDIRSDSPTFRQWAAVELSAQNHRQFYLPEGFAHGFCVLGNSAVFSYMCTEIYIPANDLAVAWNDEDIGIRWPVAPQSLSERDRNAPRLCELSQEDLPRMQA
jgi:dTDP-4-dehydrorhamnose 3,5-epimerase